MFLFAESWATSWITLTVVRLVWSGRTRSQLWRGLIRAKLGQTVGSFMNKWTTMGVASGEETRWTYDKLWNIENGCCSGQRIRGWACSIPPGHCCFLFSNCLIERHCGMDFYLTPGTLKPRQNTAGSDQTSREPIKAELWRQFIEWVKHNSRQRQRQRDPKSHQTTREWGQKSTRAVSVRTSLFNKWRRFDPVVVKLWPNQEFFS